MKTPAFLTALPANVHLLIALFLADYQQISDSLSILRKRSNHAVDRAVSVSISRISTIAYHPSFPQRHIVTLCGIPLVDFYYFLIF
jgi:hypothetical protein